MGSPLRLTSTRSPSLLPPPLSSRSPMPPPPLLPRLPTLRLLLPSTTPLLPSPLTTTPLPPLPTPDTTTDTPLSPIPMLLPPLPPLPLNKLDKPETSRQDNKLHSEKIPETRCVKL